MVFADTFYWIALINPRDSSHSKVLEYSERMQADSVVTTDEVLTEFLAWCARDVRLRCVAGPAVRQLMSASDIRVIPQSRATFLAGLQLYIARPDKGYSLTDCISMAVMRREGLSKVLTNDRHFEQEGFIAEFRSNS